jgi:general secretion pathway protein C
MAQSLITLLNNPENLQLALKKLPTLISVVLVIACAHVLSQITWSLLSEPDAEPVIAKASTPKIISRTDDQQAFRQLTGAHLFGIAGQTKTTKTTKAPETKLNLVLRGVFAAVPMTTASAIIARGKNGKEEIYGIGDKLPGGVTIKEIHPEHVVLERRGQLEILRMPKDNAIGKLTNSARSSRNTQAGTPAEALKNIRKNIIKNPTSFAQYALPVIVKENGKQVGYRLQPQKKGELLAEIGIKPTDVITSVNGVKLNDPKNGIGALRKLTTATEVNITVKRNGAEVPLNIRLQ